MKHIAVSGPAAAGKSTLIRRLSQRLGDRAAVHLERPQNNPFIREYYADSSRWSFHSQMTFLALYFDDLGHPGRDWLHDDREFCLYDRSLAENLVLARYRLEQGHLTRDEYDQIEKMALGLQLLMPPIDGYVYLDATAELLTRRLRQRGRDYENDIGRRYAEDTRRLYGEWAAHLPAEKTLVLSADEGIDVDRVIRFMENL